MRPVRASNPSHAQARAQRAAAPLLALIAAAAILAWPAPAAANHEGSGAFPTLEEACGFAAEKAQGRRFLCPLSLPARLATAETAYRIQNARPLTYVLWWEPASERGRIYLEREPRFALQRFRRSVRRAGVPARETQVRGRTAISVCLPRLCLLGWRERRSSYFLATRAPASPRRLRRDLRTIARALEPVAPLPDTGEPEPHVPPWRFGGLAEACEFVAASTARPPVLCPLAAPEGLEPLAEVEVDGGFLEGPRAWFDIDWRLAGGRGYVFFGRSTGTLSQLKRRLRRDRKAFRLTQVRGRPAVMRCGRERRFQDVPRTATRRMYCGLHWRELGTRYSIYRLSLQVRWPELRREVRALARALEPLTPA